MQSHPFLSAAALLLFISTVVSRGPAQVELTPSTDAKHAVAFAASSDAPGTVDPHEVQLCYSLLSQRLKVAEGDLPHVVVIHVSAAVAHAADVRATMVRENTGSRDSVYYEFWIVGPPRKTDYVRFLYMVLERRFRLVLTDEQRKDAGAFVLRIMSSTVSAR